MTKYKQLDLIGNKDGSINADILINKLVLGDCFIVLSDPRFEHYFDGVFTDIPFKNTIKGKLGEKEFTFEKFFELANFTTKKVSFLISFCNYLNSIDLVNYGRQYGWEFHTILIRDKSPNRSWISWNRPLRHTEYIIFLRQGNYKFSFKDGTVKKRPNRSSFGGELRKVERDTSGSRVSYGMFQEIIKAPAVPKKIRKHPAQKPEIFSEIVSKVVGENKKVVDFFCGSGVLLKHFPNSLGIDIKQYW